MLKKGAIVSLIFVLFSCSNHTVVSKLNISGDKQLSAIQIMELIQDNTLLLNSFELNSYFFFDHTGKLFVKDINNNKDIGRWDVSDADELCLKLNNWWYGDLICYNVWADDKSFNLANKVDLQLFTVKQSKGDSQHLFYETKKKAQSMRKSIRIKNKIKTDHLNSSKLQEKQLSAIDEENISALNEDTVATVRMIAKNCPGCNLSFSNLQHADLAEANLVNANLEGADLSGANLRRANLRGANLENANLTGADMPGANLANSNLKNASLKGANLYKANLTGALLTGTILQ